MPAWNPELGGKSWDIERYSIKTGTFLCGCYIRGSVSIRSRYSDSTWSTGRCGEYGCLFRAWWGVDYDDAFAAIRNMIRAFSPSLSNVTTFATALVATQAPKSFQENHHNAQPLPKPSKQTHTAKPSIIYPLTIPSLPKHSAINFWRFEKNVWPEISRHWYRVEGFRNG